MCWVRLPVGQSSRIRYPSSSSLHLAGFHIWLDRLTRVADPLSISPSLGRIRDQPSKVPRLYQRLGLPAGGDAPALGAGPGFTAALPGLPQCLLPPGRGEPRDPDAEVLGGLLPLSAWHHLGEIFQYEEERALQAHCSFRPRGEGAFPSMWLQTRKESCQAPPPLRRKPPHWEG